MKETKEKIEDVRLRSAILWIEVLQSSIAKPRHKLKAANNLAKRIGFKGLENYQENHEKDKHSNRHKTMGIPVTPKERKLINEALTTFTKQ